MIFSETRLKGAFIIEPEPIKDERGFFARTFCQDEFEQHGLNGRFVQCNISFNLKAGTMRGMHYQAAPHEEAKLVRCTLGAIYGQPYIHVINPVVPGADYTIMQTLYDEFPEERQALYELYRGAFAKNLSLATGNVVLSAAAATDVFL